MTALRIIDPPEEGAGYGGVQVGDMWRWEAGDDGARDCWMVMLPGRHVWYTTAKVRDGTGWDVTGEPPLITVTPSLWADKPAGWHGWIRDGHLTGA